MNAQYVEWTDLILQKVGRVQDHGNPDLYLLSTDVGIALNRKELHFGDDWVNLDEQMVDLETLVMFTDEPYSKTCRFGIFRDPWKNRYCVVDAMRQQVATLWM